MRSSQTTIFVAFLAGLAGSLAGNRLFVVSPVFAQTEATPPRVIRAERIELVDQRGTVRAALDASENQLPRLEFKDKSGGKDQSLLMNSSMVQLRLGDQSATFSTMGAMFFGGKNQIILDSGSMGFAAHPALLISDQGGSSHINSFSFDILGVDGKTVWATPLKIPVSK
jgi:hypothetical protein